MKKILLSILSAFMVSTMASAQYLNVKMDDGTYTSYKTSSKTEVDFGVKKGAELTPSGYYTKDEVDEIIKKLEERLARAENEILLLHTNHHEYVELAGCKWATENVEVSALTADYGYLYNLEDAMQANSSWGGTWTLPTDQQWRALIDNCYWVWTNDYNEKCGYIVYEAQADEDKGKFIGTGGEPSEVYTPTNVPHIFLPATGIRYDDGYVDYRGSDCWYWSADRATEFRFSDKGKCDMYIKSLLDAVAVRLVLE